MTTTTTTSKNHTVAELRKLCRGSGIKDFHLLSKQALLQAMAKKGLLSSIEAIKAPIDKSVDQEAEKAGEGKGEGFIEVDPGPTKPAEEEGEVKQPENDLSPELKKHRNEFAQFVASAAVGPYADVLRRLYKLAEEWNRKHFDGRLNLPHIVFLEPKSARALGDHSTISGWGSRGQIRIRPSVFDGTHKIVKPGLEYAEGRVRFVEDILLHEMVHLYNAEVALLPERSYHGHGPAFAGKCNEIGSILGLPEVGIKRQKKPLCNYWPENVRPEGYYLGALAEPEQPEQPKDPEETGELEPWDGTEFSFDADVSILFSVLSDLKIRVKNPPDGLSREDFLLKLQDILKAEDQGRGLIDVINISQLLPGTTSNDERGIDDDIPF